ncbi:MAG: DNA polymerase III subunit delta [Gammaproteobacteria bacterium]|nr:MAG: DNA polymerase III subunit delta [Gammaproteobacteria bacterium]
MKIASAQLGNQLKQGLAPVYLLSGDEPLLMCEATDLIRHTAREAGFSGREVFYVESGFDWSGFAQSMDALSLFADRRLIELRLPTAKPGDAGRKVIQAYLENPAEDIVLLIISARLDRSAIKTRWVKAVQDSGVLCQVWPVERAQLPHFIMQRLQRAGLQADTETVNILVDRAEGNLLAATQDIEKLRLLYGEGQLSTEQALEGVTDSARYDVFKLADAALAGDSTRVSRVLPRLRQEGVEPVLILWALSKEIRELAMMAREAEGQSADAVMSGHHVWAKRKPLISKALSRFSAARWQILLVHAGRIDRMIKGQAVGNAWDELLQLALKVAGLRLRLPIQ